MLDYKDIITKHYALGRSGREIAKILLVSKTGVNSFLRAFEECKTLSYPLPEGITNYGIAQAVYGKNPAAVGRDLSYEQPDYETIEKDMSSRKNMTLKVLWNRYVKRCRDSDLKFYSYRQFCENYAKWCEENKESLHFNAVVGRVNPKFCVKSISGANRAKFICCGSRLVRLPPCQQHNAGGGGCQGRRSRSFYP